MFDTKVLLMLEWFRWGQNAGLEWEPILTRPINSPRAGSLRDIRVSGSPWDKRQLTASPFAPRPHPKAVSLTSARTTVVILRNPDLSPNLIVFIISACTAGLYTTTILESLKISYQIVDAGTRDRVSGRLFVFYPSNGGPYGYYISRTPVLSHRVLTFVYRVLELCGLEIRHS